MQNIVTLGEINDALKSASVSAVQLADMGFEPLDNKLICEALPTDQSRRLRNAKLYPAESIGQIRVALAKRLAAPASCLHQIQEPAPEHDSGCARHNAPAHPAGTCDCSIKAAPAAVAVPTQALTGEARAEKIRGLAPLRAKLAAAAAADIGNPITGTAAPVVLPEPAIMPKGESAAAQLRAMATNYPTGHSWDKLDAKACIRGVLEIEALRALLATGGQAQAVKPLCWVNEDELPESMSEEAYSALFPHSKVDVVRMFPIFSAPQAQADARDAWPRHGDLVRYASGSTALALHGEPHAGGWHGVQCMGGHTFYTKTHAPSAEDRVMWVRCAVHYRGRTMDEARIEAGLSPIAAIAAAKGE